MSLAETIVQSKRIYKRVDRKEAMRHDEVMKEAETRRLQLEIQLETMRQRGMQIEGVLDKLDKI